MNAIATLPAHTLGSLLLLELYERTRVFVDRALDRIRKWINVFSASNACETDILELIFNATAWPNVADNAASSPYTNLYVGLHTADPGEAGNQTTSEATYTSYARVAVARSGSGWTVSGNSAVNASAVTFPAATGGSNTITYFSIGGASSGTGYLFFSGALSASLAVSSGITPSFSSSQCSTTAD